MVKVIHNLIFPLTYLLLHFTLKLSLFLIHMAEEHHERWILNDIQQPFIYCCPFFTLSFVFYLQLPFLIDSIYNSFPSVNLHLFLLLTSQFWLKHNLIFICYLYDITTCFIVFYYSSNEF